MGIKKIDSSVNPFLLSREFNQFPIDICKLNIKSDTFADASCSRKRYTLIY